MHVFSLLAGITIQKPCYGLNVTQNATSLYSCLSRFATLRISFDPQLGRTK
jgi:hypothetical protein